jgi:hypothetical protein
MSSWTKVKGLFWQSAPGEQDASEEISDAEFQELLATDHAVSEGPVVPIDPNTVATRTVAGVMGIDFQSEYDAAGIPNTDEVEQLERFLNGLDQNLPQASKLTAARAFLGAVGKSVDDVLRDAASKIGRVRAIRAGKEQATEASLSEERTAIDELLAAIDQRKAKMEELSRELEGVRHSCLVEESRLQAARVFFGTAAAGEKLV